MGYVTLVGSRSTATPILMLAEEVMHKLALHGLIGRSGLAPGMDNVLTYLLVTYKIKCELYLPWDGFDGFEPDGINIFDVSKFSNHQLALDMASLIHPAWSYCSPKAKYLHARNMYEVLGHNLNTPSKLLIFSAPVTKTGNVKGGTASAVNLAKTKGIPTFNLINLAGRLALADYLKTTFNIQIPNLTKEL